MSDGSMYPMPLGDLHGYRVHKISKSKFYLAGVYRGVKFRRPIAVVEMDAVAELARSIETEIDSAQSTAVVRGL